MTLELCPNEIFLEYFQYLNGFEIFQSFDQLNKRLSNLIRSIPLYLNFQHIQRNLFDKFCQIIQFNPQLKQNIYSIKLSNEDTCEQIDLFLSKFSLNEFLHLRSLTLIRIEDNNIEKLKFYLPQMHQLYSIQIFNYTNKENQLLNILPILNLRILNIPILTQINTISNIIHLSIIDCSLDQIKYWLIKCTPQLKYLTITNFSKTSTEWQYDLIDCYQAVNLKKLNILNLRYSFDEFINLIKFIPNLKYLAICSLDNICMINAEQWKSLIDLYLPNLKQFQFVFGLYCHEKIRQDILIKFQQFQTDFWSKEHQWFIEYIFDIHSAVIYTLPYLLDTYRLNLSIKTYSNQLISLFHRFNNVKELIVCNEIINENYFNYFPQVTSLNLKIYSKQNQNSILSIEYIQSLKTIIDFYYLKHLDISSYTSIEISFIIELCRITSQLSFLTIHPSLLSVLFQNRLLCEYLNRIIRKMNIYKSNQNSFQNCKEIEQFNELFSNINELICGIDQSEQLLTLLNSSSKLSIMTIFLSSSNNLDGLLIWFKNKAFQLQITYRIDCFYTHPDDSEGLYCAKLSIWNNRETKI